MKKSHILNAAGKLLFKATEITYFINIYPLSSFFVMLDLCTLVTNIIINKFTEVNQDL